MGWDASRPVPWRRLVREWLIYAGVMVGVFLLFFRDSNLVGIIGGLLASGPLYLGLNYVLAKLGYQRKTLAELRTPRASSTHPAGAAAVTAERPRPAPTRRTSGGAPHRPTAGRRRR